MLTVVRVTCPVQAHASHTLSVRPSCHCLAAGLHASRQHALCQRSCPAQQLLPHWWLFPPTQPPSQARRPGLLAALEPKIAAAQLAAAARPVRGRSAARCARLLPMRVSRPAAGGAAASEPRARRPAVASLTCPS
eukprot:351583-Chlamydomonas_euryale.AAC.1